MRTSAMTKRAVAIMVGAAIIPVASAGAQNGLAAAPDRAGSAVETKHHDQLVLHRDPDRAVPFDPVIGTSWRARPAPRWVTSGTVRRRGRPDRELPWHRLRLGRRSDRCRGCLRGDPSRDGSGGAHPAEASTPASSSASCVTPHSRRGEVSRAWSDTSRRALLASAASAPFPLRRSRRSEPGGQRVSEPQLGSGLPPRRRIRRAESTRRWEQ